MPPRSRKHRLQLRQYPNAPYRYCPAQAGHIYIFSNSLTALAAKDLEFRLGMVGIYAKAVTDIGDIRIYASCATREDFVIAIAPSLLIRDFYNAITVCKDNGAGLLSITSYDSP